MIKLLPISRLPLEEIRNYGGVVKKRSSDIKKQDILGLSLLLVKFFHEMKKGEKNGKSPYAEKISKQPIQPRFVQNILNRTALTKKNLEAPG
ncbi:unnamed protein product [Larinioides sclopetarius]|uniref:Uncharacterized protein n=1 Tax=Larinioides sclopetarius TaxID=280406 RepID=A0AAV1YSR7_9ARAC